MGVIGRREFELIMKMDDQTRKERESLNRGLGDLERTTKKASAEAKRSLVDVAKQSKASMEGIKAVMELGGWLAMANMVGSAFMNITEEARKNSVAFKEAGAALDIVGKKIGTGLVKAMEPLAEGFENVLLYGTAIFQKFPEVAKISFKYIQAIINKVFSWEGISGLFVAIGSGIVRVFSASFEYIPKLFMQVINLLFNPISKLGEYIWDTLKNAFTGKPIEDPFKFIGRVMNDQMAKLGNIAMGAGEYILAQANNLKSVGQGIGEVFDTETKAFGQEFAGVVGPVFKALKDSATAAAMASSGTTYGPENGVSAPDALLKAILTYRPPSFLQEIQALKEQSQAVAEAEKSRTEQHKAMMEKLSQDNLSGRNGLGAGIGEGIGKTEVGMGLSTGAASAAAAASAGGPVAMIIAMIVKVIGTIQNLMAVLNPIGTIFDAMMEVLGPLINNLLAPFVGILKIIGYTIGRVLAPALELLRPVIEVIAGLFTLLYNYIIKPVANLIIMAFNLLYNGIAGFINGIIWLANTALGWTGFHLNEMAYRDMNAGTLGDINTSDVNAAGSTGAGGSASYAAGTSITIEKIEIKADFIAGDAGLQDIAVMLRDKLTEAEKAGR